MNTLNAFQHCFLAASLVGAAVCLAAVLAYHFRNQIRELHERWLGLGPLGRVVSILAVTVAVLYGGTKSTTNDLAGTMGLSGGTGAGGTGVSPVAEGGTDGQDARRPGVVRIQKEILSILDAPIGATYFMTEAERKEMAGGTSKEMVFPVPLDRTANATHYWMRPLRVIVDRATNAAVGFFSFSRQFATRQEARTYLADSIGAELTRHFGKEPMLAPCGKTEYRYRYSKDGRERELRFKLFSMTGGEKSTIMTYHGFPRTDGSMEREFAAIYADLVRK